MQFPCTQVCEGSTRILESIWQERRDRHSLQASPVIARPMEQNGLFCSIKLFKPHATDAFNALNNVFQIMYFYLKKKRKTRTGIISNVLPPLSTIQKCWKTVFTWYPTNSWACMWTKNLTNTSKLCIEHPSAESFSHVLSILMPTHRHISGAIYSATCSCFQEFPSQGKHQS